MGVICTYRKPGKSFALPHHDELHAVQQFGIKPGDRVLEVGGKRSLRRADVVTELTEQLPHTNQEFDFVYCHHLLQVVANPQAVCRELMRVAKRGYIEVPVYWAEYLIGDASHRWLVDWVDETLVFRAKPWAQRPEGANSPFGGVIERYLATDNEFRHLWEQEQRCLWTVQLLWDRDFAVRVEEGPVYSNLQGNDPQVQWVDTPQGRWNVPLNNAFGPNYPRLFDPLMVDQLGIQPTDQVIDVGGGNNPFTRANVVTDLCFDDNHHRSGQTLIRYDGKRYVECEVEALPFADKEFDFAYCSHTLEHTVDPAKACEELMRVAKQGYLEVPNLWTEILLGYPAHRWLIEMVDGVLTFRRRPFVQHPFKQILRGDVFNDPQFLYRYEIEYRNLQTVQLAWEGRFEYRVIDDGGFDYDDPHQAGMSHLIFALNDKAHRVPLSYVKADLEQAVTLIPDSARAWQELAICQEAMGELDAALASMAQARKLNSKLSARGDENQALDLAMFQPMVPALAIEGAAATTFGLVIEPAGDAGWVSWLQRYFAAFGPEAPVTLVLGVPQTGDWESAIAHVARRYEEVAPDGETAPVVVQPFEEADRPRLLRALKACLIDADNPLAERQCQEAMACGVPLLGAARGPVARWLQDGQTGLSGEEEGLLRRAVERSDLKDLGQHARTMLERAFSAPRM